METPRWNRTKKQRYALVGQVCTHCEVKIFPPRDVCSNCGEETKINYNFNGKGTIFDSHLLNSAQTTTQTSESQQPGH